MVVSRESGEGRGERISIDFEGQDGCWDGFGGGFYGS